MLKAEKKSASIKNDYLRLYKLDYTLSKEIKLWDGEVIGPTWTRIRITTALM